MVQKRLRFILAFCLLAGFSAMSLLAQDHKALLGKWSMTSETEGDALHWTLILKDTDDGKLTASLVADDNEIPAKDCTFADGVVKFKAPYEGEDYDIELKADGDKLTGTWSGGGNSGRTTGTKS